MNNDPRHVVFLEFVCNILVCNREIFCHELKEIFCELQKKQDNLSLNIKTKFSLF